MAVDPVQIRDRQYSLDGRRRSTAYNVVWLIGYLDQNETFGDVCTFFHNKKEVRSTPRISAEEFDQISESTWNPTRISVTESNSTILRNCSELRYSELAYRMYARKNSVPEWFRKWYLDSTAEFFRIQLRISTTESGKVTGQPYRVIIVSLCFCRTYSSPSPEGFCYFINGWTHDMDLILPWIWR